MLCRVCGADLPAAAFAPDRRTANGLSATCQPCHERARKAGAAARARLGRRRRAWAETERACRACGQTKPLYEFPPHAGRLDGHGRTCTACQAAYRQHYLKNSDRGQLEIGDPDHHISRAQWQAIRYGSQGLCLYCGKQYDNITVDHFVPIRLGGATKLGNLVPACSPCNSAKGDASPFVWVRRTFGEARLDAILTYLGAQEAQTPG